MKNFQKGFIKIGIIVLVVILIAIIGYFIFSKITRPYPPISQDNSFDCPDIVASNNANHFISNVFPVAQAMTQAPLLAGKLCFLEKPLLNKPVILEFRFKSRQDSSDSKARIELPDGFQVVSGTTDWSGDLKSGEQVNLRVTVKSTKIGYFQVKGFATANINGNKVDDQQLAKIELDVNSNDTILNPVWDQTFVLPSKLYSAVYPKHSLWTVSQSFSDDRLQKYEFGHALSPEKFEPIILVTHYKTGYVDNSTKIGAGQTEINVNNKNLKTGVWTYYPAVKQTVTSEGKSIERVSISNWNGYDIKIDLLKPEYQEAFDTFIRLFAVLSQS